MLFAELAFLTVILVDRATEASSQVGTNDEDRSSDEAFRTWKLELASSEFTPRVWKLVERAAELALVTWKDEERGAEVDC